MTFGLTVSLNDKDTSAITAAIPGERTPTDKINTVAAGLLRDLARGGVMIPNDYAERIQAAINTAEPAEIASAVEKSVGKSGESTRVEWIVDPTQISFYQSQADNAGITLNHQLKSHMDWFFLQGGLGSSAPDPFKILLTAEQWKELQRRFGKDIPTGEDVMEALGANSVVFSDEDLMLDPLKEER